MTYIGDGARKVIGLYEDVDGYTFIELYSGFGLENGDFYKAPMEVYKDIEGFFSGKNASELPQYKGFDYRDMDGISEEYGYGTELLLFNNEINSERDLLAKKLYLSINQEIFYEEEIYLSSELIGYSLWFKEIENSYRRYLLGGKSKIDKSAEKKIYSELLVIEKDNLQMVTILQSYVQDFSAQGEIPTIIDFMVGIIGDYVVYEDVDQYWKLQDIRTKEIYSSEENRLSMQLP